MVIGNLLKGADGMKVKPYGIGDLVDYLERLKGILSGPEDPAGLRAEFGRIIEAVSKLDGMLSAPSLSKLEREGLTLMREYLKEASLESYLGHRRGAMPYIDRSLEIALILRDLDRLKGRGAELLHPDELIEVDRIDGRPVYSIRRE